MSGKLLRYNKLVLTFVEHAGLLVITIATVIAAGSFDTGDANFGFRLENKPHQFTG